MIVVAYFSFKLFSAVNFVIMVTSVFLFLGPVESGTNDFWRLLWDKHVPAIVMVTNLFERGKVCNHSNVFIYRL